MVSTTKTYRVAILLVLLAACGDSDDCPAGQTLIDALCVTTASDTGPGVLDGSTDADDAGPAPLDAGADLRATEVCNGVDDDMDGSTDEADPMLGETCGAAEGVCTIGATVCTGGALACDGVQPSEELCKGLDDDCDGSVDEDLMQDFFLDDDADGYGSGDACNACSPDDCGAGEWVTMDGDCNESCDTCYLGATEVCDELDNDCDTFVDNGVQTLLFTDVDDDGYGAGIGTPGCLDDAGEPPAGLAAEDGDCGPTDDRAFPGASASYSTPIMGDTATEPFDFDCDGVESISVLRCANGGGEIQPACRPAPGYCWASIAFSPPCGTGVLWRAVSGTTAIPGVSDGVCRFLPGSEFESYDLECN